ncbi:hypothetical protein F4805DRAFT_313999 [Annulohypoxylon moriforme]|nr:hypothetical protein F4805DRAFT_313999 [Annulohypoxylon moriforme]
MSSNLHRSGRVYNLSQHFDSMALAEGGNEHSSSTTVAEDASMPDASKTVFTGEYRMPLRDRLRTMRQGIHERKEERRKSGRVNGLEDMTLRPTRSPSRSPSPLDLNSTSVPFTPPSTPQRSRPASLALEACPGAPTKSRKYLDLPASTSGTDSDDILFDRRAHSRSPLEIASSARRSADKANERQRRRITTPGEPSPLRSSFNADEMAELAAQLDAMREEIAAKGDEDPPTPELYMQFLRK